MKRIGKLFGIACGLLATFTLWTVLLRFVDVGQIGPRGGRKSTQRTH